MMSDLRNQCDGCNAGMYRDVQGMHRDRDSNPVMVCQASKYDNRQGSRVMDEHKDCKETEDILWASIQKLERAVHVLTGSNSHWRVNVSESDARLIDRLLETINQGVE